MPIYTWNALFLGSAADIDTNETTVEAETPNALLGTYGTLGDPPKDHVVSVQVNDADADTNINTNNTAFATSETVLVDGVAHTADSAVVYNATITYMDGSSATITAVVMQTTDGDLSLLPEMSQNADFLAMEAEPIRSLTLNLVSVNPTNMGANRTMTDFVCFGGATMIATPDGQRRIDALCRGDHVLTHDNGPQPIRAIARRAVGIGAQIVNPALIPVLLRTSALGPGLPDSDLHLSRHHRVLVRARAAARMFGQAEVLVPAKSLVGLEGIGLAPAKGAIEYFRLFLDRHEIILANRVLAESLYLGDEANRVISRLPERDDVARCANTTNMRPARLCVEGRRATSLARRLRKLQTSHALSLHLQEFGPDPAIPV